MASRQKKKSGNDEGDEGETFHETSEVSEPIVEDDGQTALFGESKEKQGPLVNGQPPKAKSKPKEAKQGGLFEEKKEVDEKENGKTFTPGDSIELDL